MRNFFSLLNKTKIKITCTCTSVSFDGFPASHSLSSVLPSIPPPKNHQRLTERDFHVCECESWASNWERTLAFMDSRERRKEMRIGNNYKTLCVKWRSLSLLCTLHSHKWKIIQNWSRESEKKFVRIRKEREKKIVMWVRFLFASQSRSG